MWRSHLSSTMPYFCEEHADGAQLQTNALTNYPPGPNCHQSQRDTCQLRPIAAEHLGSGQGLVHDLGM